MLCSLQICEELGVKTPVNVKMFTGKSKLLLNLLNGDVLLLSLIAVAKHCTWIYFCILNVWCNCDT